MMMLKISGKYNPQILTGINSIYGIVDLKPQLSPKALVSSAMKLTKGTKK
jgi:phenylacetate-CoA ligase